MDLVSACRAFVSVADRGSFTRGAAAVGASQSVVSRRVAALEAHLGGTLLDRSGRAPTPTLLGRRLLPTARRVVELTESLLVEADEVLLTSVAVAVPAGCDVRDLAASELAARDQDVALTTVEADPRRRSELLARGQVAAALLAVPYDAATWRVPLGVAGAVRREGRLHLDQLQPRRGQDQRTSPRLWLLAEDDVPHVRDPLTHAVEGAGMPASRVVRAPSPAAALTAALGSSDLVLTSAAEAARLDLAWSPLASPTLARGYDLVAPQADDAARLLRVLHAPLARALGASASAEAGP